MCQKKNEIQVNVKKLSTVCQDFHHTQTVTSMNFAQTRLTVAERLLRRPRKSWLAELGFLDDSGMANSIQPAALNLHKQLRWRHDLEDVIKAGIFEPHEALTLGIKPILANENITNLTIQSKFYGVNLKTMNDKHVFGNLTVYNDQVNCLVGGYCNKYYNKSTPNSVESVELDESTDNINTISIKYFPPDLVSIISAYFGKYHLINVEYKTDNNYNAKEVNEFKQESGINLPLVLILKHNIDLSKNNQISSIAFEINLNKILTKGAGCQFGIVCINKQRVEKFETLLKKICTGKYQPKQPIQSLKDIIYFINTFAKIDAKLIQNRVFTRVFKMSFQRSKNLIKWNQQSSTFSFSNDTFIPLFFICKISPKDCQLSADICAWQIYNISN